MKRIAWSGIGIALLAGLVVVPAGAQSQPSSNQSSPSSQSSAASASSGTSLGDYAKQIRKAPADTSKPKVFDNDNLPSGDKLSVVGNATDNTPPPAAVGDNSSQSQPAAAATPGSTAPAPGTPEDDAAKQAAWKQWGDRIAQQKDQIDLLTRELDVLDREYKLRAAAMYADVGNRMRNSTDWDKQDAQYKQQIADKQKAVDDAKQKLDDMMEEARKAGVPASVREP
jgi:hypothetical protein